MYWRTFLGFELLLRGFEFVSEDSEIFGLLREFVDLMLGVFIWLAETRGRWTGRWFFYLMWWRSDFVALAREGCKGGHITWRWHG